MSKRHHSRQQQRSPQLQYQIIVALKDRSDYFTMTQHQHRMGQWRSAKRDHGRAAVRSYCLDCGAWVAVIPNGMDSTRTPSLAGAALTTPCSHASSAVTISRLFN